MELFILIVLFIIWMIYRSKVKNIRKELKIENNFKKIKKNIKKQKPYSRIEIIANIIIIMTSGFLSYALILAIINIFLITMTLGMFLLAGSGSIGKSMLDAAEFNGEISGYVIYILLYTIVIKNILFNNELHKFLKNSNVKNDEVGEGEDDGKKEM